MTKTSDSGARCRLAVSCSPSAARSDLKFVFAISYAQAIRGFVDQGEDALRSELKRWEPDVRAAVASAFAEVA